MIDSTKIWLWIMIFFLCWVPKKEFSEKEILKSITYSTNWVRLMWWVVIGFTIWRG